jgi:transposase
MPTVDTAPEQEIIIGIDTHKSIHVAVAINSLGARLGEISVPVSPKGYSRLEAWAVSFGRVRAFGIEGTGSYGAGLTRSLLERGHLVIEVNRPNRQLRHQHGKNDALDAESAARMVLSGQATAAPKLGTGIVEMIRHLKIARDTAVKARSQAIITLKTLIINAPEALRECLDAISGKISLIRHIAAWRTGPISSPTVSVKYAMRALARRWLALNDEVRGHDEQLAKLTNAYAPTLLQAPGIASGTAAEMLVLVGDNPDRIKSDAAFAKLCGVCPIPASSGKTNRHRLNRGGNRKANAAIYRVVISRMRCHGPTLVYVRRRLAEGKTKQEIIRCLKRFVAREIFGLLCRAEGRNTEHCAS